MIKQVHAPGKNYCCKSQQPKSSRFGPREFDFRAEDCDISGGKPLHSLPKFNLMDLPLHPPAQPKLAAGDGEQATGDRIIDSTAPVVQRYVKVGLYEGSLGMDHIGVGVNSEKTKGFSPKSGQGQEAEKGSWVEGEVKEDHDLIDSLTIKTNPGQEARLQTAMNRSESSSQKFHLYQHNCAHHGAQILNSAGLGAKSSPMPRAFFEGLKRQFEPGKEAEGKPVQGRFEANARATEQVRSEPNRTGMPDRLKTGIESLSGIDMSDVRVHANSERPAKLNALAYTQGNQIYLGPGQERHLAHEAWHAVQQKQGRVRATKQMSGVSINDDLKLEREANGMGVAAIQGGLLQESSIANFSMKKQYEINVAAQLAVTTHKLQDYSARQIAERVYNKEQLSDAEIKAVEAIINNNQDLEFKSVRTMVNFVKNRLPHEEESEPSSSDVAEEEERGAAATEERDFPSVKEDRTKIKFKGKGRKTDTGTREFKMIPEFKKWCHNLKQNHQLHNYGIEEREGGDDNLTKADQSKLYRKWITTPEGKSWLDKYNKGT